MTRESRNSDRVRRMVTPLDGFMFDAQKQAAIAREQFEEQVVNLLFSCFGLPAAEKHVLRHRCKGRTGHDNLTLADFFESYPSFPLRFVIHRFRGLPRVLTVSQLFGNFARQPFARAFARVYEELDPDSAEKSAGLLFSWPNVNAGLVLHNCPPDLQQPGGRFYWVNPENPRECLVLEPLRLLLQSLSAKGEKRWSPDE
jgi:hypothetical protein